MTRTAPQFQRLSVDERRSMLLDEGRRLFTSYGYDELSMAMIAREAGISKALLYHYFPSKQAYFVATLQGTAAELADRVLPDDGAPLRAQLESALDAWLSWVEDNSATYAKLMRSAHSATEVRELIEGVRDATTRMIAERLLDGGPVDPAVRNAINGWLWFVDGACSDWIRHGDLGRDHVRAVLLDALPCALAAAGRKDLSGALESA